jgi:hypothetical protein
MNTVCNYQIGHESDEDRNSQFDTGAKNMKL